MESEEMRWVEHVACIRKMKIEYRLQQSLSDCGTHTTSGTKATVQWYTGLVRKNQRIKYENENPDTPHMHKG
jgi:hypothetical protein